MARVFSLDTAAEEIRKNLARSFQSANVNFLIGSGASYPAIPSAGAVEEEIASLFETGDEDAAYLKLYGLLATIQAPTNKLIAGVADPNNSTVVGNYTKYLGIIEAILTERRTTLLPKQATIFTTNYDLFIEQASLPYLAMRLNDGFSRVPSLTGRSEYSSRNFFTTTSSTGNLYNYKVEIPCINLMKLHGSLSWKKDGDSILFSVTNTPLLPAGKTAAQVKAFVDAYAVVLPKTKKFHTTLMDGTYYELLRIYNNELDREGTLLVSFGFSFGDSHILGITRRALKNPTLRLRARRGMDDTTTADSGSIAKREPVKATILNVLIASPSDVPTERDAVESAIHEWNANHHAETGIILLPVRWETHSYPWSGDRPQAILNKQIVDSSHLLLGIFGNRLGTPTGKAQSGTIEEIEEFRRTGRYVALYFSSAPVPRDADPNQLEALEQYKKQRQQDTLYSTFNTADKLRKLVTQHLPKIVPEVYQRVRTGAGIPRQTPCFLFIFGVPLGDNDSAEWLMMLRHYGPNPAYNCDITFYDGDRKNIEHEWLVKHPNSPYPPPGLAGESQKRVHVTETGPEGAAGSFVWHPLDPNHQHYTVSISCRDGVFEEKWEVTRVNGILRSSITVERGQQWIQKNPHLSPLVFRYEDPEFVRAALATEMPKEKRGKVVHPGWKPRYRFEVPAAIIDPNGNVQVVSGVKLPDGNTQTDFGSWNLLTKHLGDDIP